MTVFVTADIPAYACVDSLLEQCWRETVDRDDIVYVILGPYADRALPQLDALPGEIRIVSETSTIEQEFVLSSAPLDPHRLPANRINLHGRANLPVAPQPRQLCVSIALTGFRPLALSEARARAMHLNRATWTTPAAEFVVRSAPARPERRSEPLIRRISDRV